MAQDNGSLLGGCLVLFVAGGLIIMVAMTIYFPAAAPIVLAIVIAVVVSLYLCCTSKSKAEREETMPRASPETRAIQQQRDETQARTEATSSSTSRMDDHATRSDVRAQSSPSPSTPQAQAEKGQDSVENLQARIAELEKRVRWLRQRLAGLAPDAMTPEQSELDGKSAQASPAEETKELSERALQQLLEALDEKVAKGTISQQLYQRLRDKYLARLGKSRGKREAAPDTVPGKPRRKR